MPKCQTNGWFIAVLLVTINTSNKLSIVSVYRLSSRA